MRILGNRKAVSGSISAMFVVLIFLMAASSLFSYNLSQDHYNDLVNQRNQRDWERQNEILYMDLVQRLASGALNATVKNNGAVAAHLVTAWLSAYNGTGSPLWQQQYKTDIWISSGQTITNFGANSYTYSLIYPPAHPVTSILLSDANLNYTVKIVTERGNSVIGRYQRLTPVAPSTVGWWEGKFLIIDNLIGQGSGNYYLNVRNNGTTAAYLTGGYVLFMQSSFCNVGYLDSCNVAAPLPPQASTRLNFRFFNNPNNPSSGTPVQVTLFGVDANQLYFIQVLPTFYTPKLP